MIFYSTVQLINAILFFSTGLFVYLQDKNNRLHKTFFLFCLSVFVWGIFYFIWHFSTTYEEGLFWVRTLHIGAVFIPSTYVHHVFIFLGIDKEANKKMLIRVGYILSFIFLAITYMPIFVKSVAQELCFPYWPKPGPLYHIFIAYMLIYPIYSWHLIKSKYQLSSAQEKSQIRSILTASIVAFIGGWSNFFLFYSIPIPPFVILIIVYPTVISYLILRHKLFGINVIIKKGVVCSILGGFITAVFFTLMLIIEKSFQGLLGYQTLFITSIVGFGLALGFIPLKDFLQKIVDRRFFRGTLEEISSENEHFRQEILKQDRMKAAATLSASMAHEIKNPLTTIKTYAEFLPEKYNDKSFIDSFTRLVKPEIEKINFAVQQLLDFSKPAVPDLKPVNPFQILNEILELLTSDFLKNKVKTDFSFSDNNVSILADKNQLKQVFLNLFLNSIDAMPQGGNLVISSAKINDGKFIEVCIEDTGCGISKENLKRIFQPFFTTKQNGTGLGLSVVHDIIEQHKATIRAESKDGEGTKFIIKFAIVPTEGK